MPTEEQVLVIERKVLDELGAFQGLAFDVDRYLDRFFQPNVPRFIPRAAAETDPGFKQLIPYVLIACQEKLLSYVRGQRAGEKRLVGNRSVGVGGHINPDDDMPLFADNFRDAYLSAVQREVNEEITIDSPHQDRVVALLNDDSNEVGQVHLGIVHLWTLDQPRVSKREQMMTQLEFMTPDALRAQRDTLETWSQRCLDAWDRLPKSQSTCENASSINSA